MFCNATSSKLFFLKRNLLMYRERVESNKNEKSLSRRFYPRWMIIRFDIQILSGMPYYILQDFLNVVLLPVSKSFTWFICYYNPCKSFTYVTKTCPNLSTYSRKPGNHDWHHYFWDWIQNSHFCDCQKQNVTSFLVLLLSVTFSVNKNKPNSQSICEKVKFDKDFNWLGRTFSWYQSQK